MDSHLVQVLLPRLEELKQSCHNLFVLSTWKKNAPCWRGGEETTTPQAVKASNSHVLGVHVHQENTQFSINQLMECQLQTHEVVQKLVNTSLFSFQDLKLSTKDIIAILKDTINTTSSPLLIPDPHATEVPSNTLERHSISSRVADGVCNLVTSSNIAKLMGSPTSNFTLYISLLVSGERRYHVI